MSRNPFSLPAESRRIAIALLVERNFDTSREYDLQECRTIPRAESFDRT